MERRRTRRLAGYLWCLFWTGVLWLVASPWRHLGGLVDERLRWLEWFALFACLAVGYTVGRFGRDRLESGGPHTHAGEIRWALYPVLVAAAAGLAILWLRGAREGVGIALTALVAYWAGLDGAMGAFPLMEGRAWRLDRPLDPEPEDEGRGRDWVPPWERF